jgi:hypothetical protein
MSFLRATEGNRTNEYGFVLLRSLLILIIIILCFSVLAVSAAVYARQETILLNRVINAIQQYNETQQKQVTYE